MQMLLPRTAPALGVGEICMIVSNPTSDEGSIQAIPASALKAISYHHGLLHGPAFPALDLKLSSEKRWGSDWFAGSQARHWAWFRHRGSRLLHHVLVR